ncbi:prolyl 3-hydroxylase OGFOD1-like [Bolinopsis microptera]|uniref:prolyl 3-hydroxylase OGFOD1-like n=1 Tax=Bolinopsis microptera TaxID=2820187 RepID=UPI00307A65E1
MAVAKKRKIFPSMHFLNGLEQDDVISSLKEHYGQSQKASKTECYNLNVDPFKVCTFHDILKNDSAMGLLEEIQNMDFTFKENDLLSLHQTIDLNDVKTPCISAVRDFIYTEVKTVIEKVTSSSFNNTVDMHGIKFMQHDNLLCHSDCLNTRHTAFILYLVPKTWSPESGGTLDLFNSDKDGNPTDVGKSLCPKFNTFSWFEVSAKSWHQVSEILEDDIRWSISGWFHSEDSPIVNPIVDEFVMLPILPMDSDLDVLKSWISLKYLNLEISSEVQEKFQEDSEVSLGEFLNPEKYSALCAALQSMDWATVGPRDKKKYQVCNKQSATVLEFMELLKTDAFALLLSHFTGLPLSTNYDDPDCDDFSNKPFGMISSSVSRWDHGFYSLLCDQEVDNLPDLLHIFYHTEVHPEYDVDAGGYVSFISHSDKEPLLVIPPQDNTISLVFTRTDEFGFTKYINAKLPKPFYCFNARYVSRTPNEERGNSDLSNEVSHL